MHWIVIALSLLPGPHAQAAEAIDTVSIDANRAFFVNHKPFFPIMIWLQDPENFPKALEAGCNTVAGYWPGSGGTADVAEYMTHVQSAGMYGVMPFDEKLKGNSALLGYIHDDEPDLSHPESDAEIIPDPSLRINEDAPLWKIFDGVTHTWSVLDPLEGAGFTVKLKTPVKVEKLAVWLTASPRLSVAKDVEFLADGRPLVSGTLESKLGSQELSFAPTELTELTVRVKSTYEGEQPWGSISEIEGFDAEGQSVLLCAPRQVPRQSPEETLATYRAIKQADDTRPVFLTVTANFMPAFAKWTPEEREPLYRAYAEAADAIGFDVYPLYGWGRPEWIDRVRDGAELLQQLAGNRPTYQWIETNKGSEWVSEARQVDVTPRHIRAEVWMAICQGATAIGYFTHVWKPAYSQFKVPERNVAAMKWINDQITRLTPVLATANSKTEVKIAIPGHVRADIMAKDHEGFLHLFGVVCDPRERGGDATISVAGLPAGTEVEVIDEGRTITADEGGFVDYFGPLEVHAYRIKQW